MAKDLKTVVLWTNMCQVCICKKTYQVTLQRNAEDQHVLAKMQMKSLNGLKLTEHLANRSRNKSSVSNTD